MANNIRLRGLRSPNIPSTTLLGRGAGAHGSGEARPLGLLDLRRMGLAARREVKQNYEQFADADFTPSLSSQTFNALENTTPITAARTLTLEATKATLAEQVAVRLLPSAFAWTIKDGGGATLVTTTEASRDRYGVFIFDGTEWVLFNLNKI